MSELQIFQDAHEILQSGSFTIGGYSAPIWFKFGAESVLVEFDLDEPFTRPDGTVIDPEFGPDAVEPSNASVRTAKVKPLGDARLEYWLAPIGERVKTSDGTDRLVYPSYTLHYRLVRDAPAEMSTAKPSPVDWAGVQVARANPFVLSSQSPAQQFVDERLLSFEERARLQNQRMQPAKRFKNSHEAG